MPPWNAPRTKVQIKLSIQRLRTLQQKKSALAKSSRREIADLLAKGRVETCRLRVEGLIQDDIYVELLELLELYLEMLQARFNILEASPATEPDPSISDAVCSIVYAAPRTELKELQVLREILMHRFGRTFALSLLPTEPPPPTVPARIAHKLKLFTPGEELVDAYLWEIGKSYKVDWVPERLGAGEDEGGEDGGVVKEEGKENKEDENGEDGDNDGGDVESREKEKESQGSPKKVEIPNETKLTEEEELAQRFERLKNL
ncbi:hypothetical protein C349_03326 [Cryptococcus neoformans var. grubii Br795]|uniref:DUF292-domain-containing protein n=1 Tax=Cryptococcus neoformans Tu259-1 TaxID=1230072 RepID=A0A854QGB5_CRYNE|nr:hypothetical protein C353_03300 [Cryptococcus neoformans var. grubii AD1-83a]OWZ54214.1 hypothetical protein C368_03353 [Cryptococcus neoformans var. grubii 125.91]OXC84575.1 hypothetical protein C344_03154 [Cryptococcus neoformans var. grubii AD1-7a]OXG20626.1 hypothetical protein C361_03600 [Cryptococcus neoformans var. grubii Tu259-1]OXG32622.1 hypothetical protein C360_03792 [Cryptococcus neoformans var. grubii Bt15]OXG41295.1 hypothetical protein C359_02696 [Cryptococcus neoformans var